MDSLFSEDSGMEPALVDGVPVVVLGKLEDAAVLQLPQSTPPEDFDRISRAFTEAAGEPPIVLTSNVRMVKLTKIDAQEAASIQRQAAANRKAMETADESDGDGSLADGERIGDAGSDVATDKGAPADGALDGAPESGLVKEPREG
jgi:hypothetical protein